MIILVTGVPGSGKTAWLVNELATGKYQNRPLYVDGIPELTLNHELIEEGGQNWHKAPDGSVIVVDEAQRVFRPRPAGSKVPEYVSALETHRHKGHDLFVVTQHPNLLDANLRRLVGRHIHIRVTAMGRYWYEWPECKDPESKAARAESASGRYTLPKKAFGLYKSSELHTKIKRRVPAFVWVLGAAVVGLGLLGLQAKRAIDSKVETSHQVTSSAPAAEAAGATAQPAHALPVAAAPTVSTRAVDPALDPLAMVPRVSGQPETAPAFDHLRQVSTMRQISGCVASATKCACYDQQAVKVEMPETECRRNLGGRFNAYASPQPNTGAYVPAKPAPAVQSAPFVPPAPALTSSVAPAVDLLRTPPVNLLATPAG